ncbi:MAG TPA: hypothetical protein VMF89_18170 [Polyangiales bacterium]|nr:hypothetical protein [Polyangiales bacterium]
MKTPVRWLDDPTLAVDLRADLECVQAHSWQPDLARAAASLDAALDAEPNPEPTDSGARSTPELAKHAASSSSTAGVLAPKLVLLALSGSLIVAAGVWQLQPAAAPTAETTPERVGPQAIVQTTPQASSSRREIEQLKRIYATLDRDPAEAYRLARASLEEIPRGTLREEREGLAVIALWQSGNHAGARALAQSFLAHYPESALRERIRKLIASEPKP